MTVQSNKILVAPLNWGLGHATRCIPIINALIADNFNPVIASDGEALALLQAEFPNLTFLELPSYGIRYAHHSNQKKALIKDSPKILKAIWEEKKFIKKLVKKEAYAGIISDNRFGVYSKNVPSIYMTHQVNVLSGNTSKITSKIHQFIIKKFDECWIPDSNSNYFAGAMSKCDFDVNYIGNLSRLKKTRTSLKYDLTILLSGPEPQRSLLEQLLINELENYTGKVLLVRGTFKTALNASKMANLEVKNMLLGKELNSALNASKLILSRSGYSSILDLAKLQKKAFFIPTPGQYEQEYLAEFHSRAQRVPYKKQSEFKIEDLNLVEDFTGFTNLVDDQLNPNLFNLFKRKREQ